MKTYAYGLTEELYHGDYDTAEEAAAAGFADHPERTVINVGEKRAPISPEDSISGDDLIEMVEGQDDYSLEVACDWPGNTKEQAAELTSMLRQTFGEWLDKHDLRPTHFIVENIREIARPSPN